MKQLKSTTLFTGMLIFGLSSAPFDAHAAEKPPASDSTQEMLSESFSTITKTLEKAQNQVSEAVGQRDQAREQLAISLKNHEAKDRQLAELRKQLAESQKLSESWKTKAVAFENTANEWKKKADEQAGLLAIGKNAQEKLGLFRSRLETTMKEFAALEGELVAIRQELKQPRDMVALVNENRNLKAEAGKASQNVKQLAADHEKSLKDIAETRKELAAAKQSLASLREGQQRSSQTADAERAKLSAELTAAKSAAENVRKQLAQVEQSRVEAVQALQQERLNAARNLEAAKKELEEAGNQAATYNKELADAKSKLAGAAESQKNLVGTVAKRDKTIAELQLMLNNREEKIETAENKAEENPSDADSQ